MFGGESPPRLLPLASGAASQATWDQSLPWLLIAAAAAFLAHGTVTIITYLAQPGHKLPKVREALRSLARRTPRSVRILSRYVDRRKWPDAICELVAGVTLVMMTVDMTLLGDAPPGPHRSAMGWWLTLSIGLLFTATGVFPEFARAQLRARGMDTRAQWLMYRIVRPLFLVAGLFATGYGLYELPHLAKFLWQYV